LDSTPGAAARAEAELAQFHTLYEEYEMNLLREKDAPMSLNLALPPISIPEFNIPVAEWEVVKKKPRATRRARPDAVVVQASGKSYSEVLAMVTRREDKQLSDLGSCVSKVRRTINGNLLLEVAKGSAESAEAMKESIARVLDDAASVRAMSDETKLLVRNQGDSDRSSMVTNTGKTHAISNTTELQVVSEPNIRPMQLIRNSDQAHSSSTI